MRKAFVDTLLELAARDERIFLLTADLGWSALEPFASRFPNQFLNVGVAEQNMLGVATGLAKLGYLPFAYSIATFASMRCYEQFRNGPVLHGLPVRLVGMGGGFSYGHAGPTHYGLEDLALARLQPGVMALAPADSAQACAVLKALVQVPGPAYLRLDKTEEADVPGLDGRFSLDTPELVRPGTDLLFLATGSLTREALRAAELLQDKAASAAVAVAAHLSFRGGPALVRLLQPFRHVVSVEEGFVVGGLGSLAGETIAEHRLGCRLLRLGVEGPVGGLTGSREYMRRQHGLDGAGLARRALDFLRAEP